MNVHLIAIVGGSGSGKTWLAERLLAEFGDQAGRISLDDFYRDLSPVPEAQRSQVNFDDPESIDWPLFHQTLTRLRTGGSVPLPSYDFATHTRRPETKPWQPRRLVLLDGLWLLRDAELRALYSLSIFVACAEDVRLARRTERDQRERGRSAQSVRTQFLRHVAPMHRRFVAPQTRHADLVVESGNGGALLPELRAVLGRLLQTRKETP
jgi:uridine kinase